MLGHGAGIGYTGPGLWMGPIDNFSLVTGPPSRHVIRSTSRSRRKNYVDLNHRRDKPVCHI